MPQFDVSFFSSQLFWLVIVFGFLYFIVSKFIAPKAEIILKSRNSYFESNILEAQNYSDQVAALESDRQLKIIELNADIKEMKESSMKALDSDFNLKKQELELILKKNTDKVLQEIEKSVKAFYTEQPKACIDLASFIIEKITNKNADLKILNNIYEKAK